MLEFSSFFDAHFHLVQCCQSEDFFSKLNAGLQVKGCSCVHSEAEWRSQEMLLEALNGKAEKPVLAFGLHPQMPEISSASFLEELLVQNKIQAIGECGFDFFTPEFRAKEALQEEAWHLQLELAAKYNKPVVIHIRKALEKVFRDIKLLQKVPAVLFHSFPAGHIEAESVLKKLPDAYFSFGKQLLNGNKKSISCVVNLPLKNLLLETDAPYQTLKGEAFTSFTEIRRVYEAAFALRPSLTCESLEHNFNSLYQI